MGVARCAGVGVSAQGARWKLKIRAPQGVVYVEDDRYDPYWPPAAPPGTPGRYRNRQYGYRWERGVMVWVERWKLPDETGAFAWTDWTEKGRSDRRVRPPRRPVVPDLTDEEKDAWADLAWHYVIRKDDEGRHFTGATTGDLAMLLPGWDDTQTFEPDRTPKGFNTPLWTQAFYDANGCRPARTRAYALAGMALRWLVKQGRAEKVGEMDLYLPKESA